jgi:hypothetical protein
VKDGLFDDLKKHILSERINVPISGIAKAAKIAHIHATRSSSGKLTKNCLSLPENDNKIKFKKHTYYNIAT